MKTKYTAQFLLRLTRQMYADLKREARFLELTTSQYLRKLIREAMAKEKP